MSNDKDWDFLPNTPLSDSSGPELSPSSTPEIRLLGSPERQDSQESLGARLFPAVRRRAASNVTPKTIADVIAETHDVKLYQ